MNPVDYVWFMSSMTGCPTLSVGASELRTRITAEFRSLQKQPRLLESLFRRAGLPLTPNNNMLLIYGSVK